jgi:hypothetical protein
LRRSGKASRGPVGLTGAIYGAVLAAGMAGCATGPIGRGGPVFEVRVASVNGQPTALTGPAAHPACLIQVANRVVTVWLARPSHADRESPVVLEADAQALKDGILVERSWTEAVVHHATDDELAAGAAVVYVPGRYGPTTVELRFERVSRLSHLDRQDDLAKHRAGLEQPVRGGDVH